MFLASVSNAGIQLEESDFHKQQVEYRYTYQESANQILLADSDEIILNKADRNSFSAGVKSPAKAFMMSLLVPGLGQYYNGSKTKTVIFAGAEITSWFFHIKLHNDGNDLTQVYEDYNNTHWSEARYDSMLLWTYGVTDDEDADASFQEINHHLPDTKTQQYYEMTGKYDQFSWGWDEAELDGFTFIDYSSNNPFPELNSPENIPFSANRVVYEGLRNDANNKYDAARRWIYVSMINHLVSAFDALFSAKKINNEQLETGNSFLSRVSVHTKLKSFHAYSDTPYVTCKLTF